MGYLKHPLWEKLLRECIATLKSKPHPGQEPILFDPTRIKIVGGGERAGKSDIAARIGDAYHHAELILNEALGIGDNYLYWLVGEDYGLCMGEFEHLVAFEQERDNIAELSIPKDHQCVLVTKTGARFENRTAFDPRKLGVSAPNGVIGCEVGLWTPETWRRVRGRIAEKRAWAILTGSFEGAGSEFHTWWERANINNDYEMRSFSLPTWSNTIIYPGGVDDAEINSLRAFFPPERFQERFGGIPSRLSGLVLKLFDPARHIADVEFDPAHPVQLWIDPGRAHAYAVLVVQMIDNEVRIVDEIYVRGMTHSQVVLIAKARDWIHNVTKIIMDKAGRQKNANGEACYDVWRKSLEGITVKTNHLSEIDNIDRINSFLLPAGQTQLPLLRVSRRAKGLLTEAGVTGYTPTDMMFMRAWRYPTRKDGSLERERPVDEFNDASKALGYGLVANFGFVMDQRGIIPGERWFEVVGEERPNLARSHMSNIESWMADLFDDLFLNPDLMENKGLWDGK